MRGISRTDGGGETDFLEMVKTRWKRDGWADEGRGRSQLMKDILEWAIDQSTQSTPGEINPVFLMLQGMIMIEYQACSCTWSSSQTIRQARQGQARRVQ